VKRCGQYLNDVLDFAPPWRCTETAWGDDELCLYHQRIDQGLMQPHTLALRNQPHNRKVPMAVRAKSDLKVVAS
jgi:hypothetical protein